MCYLHHSNHKYESAKVCEISFLKEYLVMELQIYRGEGSHTGLLLLQRETKLSALPLLSQTHFKVMPRGKSNGWIYLGSSTSKAVGRKYIFCKHKLKVSIMKQAIKKSQLFQVLKQIKSRFICSLIVFRGASCSEWTLMSRAAVKCT